MKDNLDNKIWGEFALTDIFEKIQRGKRLKKEDHSYGIIPYASSTGLNNGIDGFIGNVNKVRVFSNCLTLANSGSVGATFYQPFSVIASDHVTQLENPRFNKYVYLFLSTIIKRISEKYGFNREINDTRIKKEKILLPINNLGDPDYIYMEDLMKSIECDKHKQYKIFISKRIKSLKTDIVVSQPLQDKNWGEFFMEDIFIIKSGRRLVKSQMDNGIVPFIGASDSNNGITEFVGNRNSSLDKNVLGVNYNGSVVENFYHSYEALFSDDVKRLSFKKILGNKHMFLFVKNMILSQKSKYEYGYKFNGDRMKRQKIMLPLNDEGNPDYSYMENYMKNIEYYKLIKYLQ